MDNTRGPNVGKERLLETAKSELTTIEYTFTAMILPQSAYVYKLSQNLTFSRSSHVQLLLQIFEDLENFQDFQRSSIIFVNLEDLQRKPTKSEKEMN